MHDAREARIDKSRGSGRQNGAGRPTVAVTAAVCVRWDVALIITFADDVVAGEFTHHIMTIVAVLVVVMMVVMVMTVVAIRTAFTDRSLVMIGHR